MVVEKHHRLHHHHQWIDKPRVGYHYTLNMEVFKPCLFMGRKVRTKSSDLILQKQLYSKLEITMDGRLEEGLKERIICSFGGFVVGTKEGSMVGGVEDGNL